MSVPDTERLVMTMGDVRIQMALREMSMDDLVGLLHFLPPEARRRIEANLSARVARAAELVLDKGPPDGAGEAFSRAEGFLRAFASRDVGDVGIEGPRADPESGAGGLADAMAAIAELSRVQGTARAVEFGRGMRDAHPLVREGLGLLGETRDPETFEECLESLFERYLAHERAKAEIVREGLLAAFYGRDAEETRLRCRCKAAFPLDGRP